MKLRFVVPCRTAHLQADGTANAIGTIDLWRSATFPFSPHFALLVAVEIQGDDEPWTIRVVSPDGLALWRADMSATGGGFGDDGSRSVRYLPIDVQFEAAAPGDYVIEALTSSNELLSSQPLVFLKQG